MLTDEYIKTQWLNKKKTAPIFALFFSSLDFVHFYIMEEFSKYKKKTSFVLPILTDNRLQIEQFDSDMRRFIYLLFIIGFFLFYF